MLLCPAPVPGMLDQAAGAGAEMVCRRFLVLVCGAWPRLLLLFLVLVQVSARRCPETPKKSRKKARRVRSDAENLGRIGC